MALELTTHKEDHRIAYLAALAIAIHIAESAFPSPIPGIKPGLANVVTVAVLIEFGWAAAAWVSLLRVIVGSLIIGTFLSPTFALSLSGALASLSVLFIAYRLFGHAYGPVGYCLLASLAHIGGQFVAAYLLFIPHAGLINLLPILLTAAIAFGLASGWITQAMINTRARE